MRLLTLLQGNNQSFQEQEPFLNARAGIELVGNRALPKLLAEA
jgi:hypothetical protein